MHLLFWYRTQPGSPTKVPVNMMRSGRCHEAKFNFKVQLNGGYCDLATPYFAAEYELHQLPIQGTLQGNIEIRSCLPMSRLLSTAPRTATAGRRLGEIFGVTM